MAAGDEGMAAKASMHAQRTTARFIRAILVRFRLGRKTKSLRWLAAPVFVSANNRERGRYLLFSELEWGIEGTH